MRSMHLTHAVLASLLWCAAVFAFVGMNFMKFETASRTLRDMRIETGLSELQRTFQIEMDKGASLSQLKKTEGKLARYKNEEQDVISVLVFDAGSGKILFSTFAGQIGIDAAPSWREKCMQPGTVFVETAQDKETIGLPVFNAFGENAGCLAAEYKTEMRENIRQQMIKTALHFAIRLAVIGVCVCFVVYLFGVFADHVFGQNKVRRGLFLVVVLGVFGIAVPLNLSSMFRAFEKDLKPEISSKTQTLARLVKSRIEQAVQSGVPFKSIVGIEAYLDQIRQKNSEILFVLVTDKTGRVLYEAGTASKAFDADPRTGKISLRDGYYNAAEPVNAGNAALGWVQIGVNERFVREEVF